MFSSVQIKPNARLWWGGPNTAVSSREIPLKYFNESIDQEDGYHLVNLTQSITNSTEFNILVKAHVIDSKKCAGNETSYTYSGKILNHPIKLFTIEIYIVRNVRDIQ